MQNGKTKWSKKFLEKICFDIFQDFMIMWKKCRGNMKSQKPFYCFFYGFKMVHVNSLKGIVINAVESGFFMVLKILDICMKVKYLKLALDVMC